MPKHPKVFLEFTIGSKNVGKVVFELYNDITPITAENFRGLCTGEYARQQAADKKILGTTTQSAISSKLHYLGSRIHRIVDGFVIQGGDITKGDGTGGECIYPEKKTFKDENFERRHAHAGILSMANCGPDTNSSQFFITLQECQHLDGKHVVFGQVIEGMDTIRQIAKVPTDMTDRPRIPVHVFNCGEVLDDEDSDAEVDSEQEAQNNAFSMYQRRQAKKDEKETAKLQQKQEEQKQPSAAESFQRTQEQIAKLQNPQSGLSAFERRKAELKLKINQAVKLNNKAVLEEQQRLTDPQYERKMAKQEFFKDLRLQERDLETKGINKEKQYLFETAIQAEKQMGSRKRKRNRETKEAYGWEVFNTDSLYRAYEKRVNRMPKLAAQAEAAQGEALTKTQRIELMAREVEERIEKRNQFSRRRTFNSDKDVTSINERNRHFNEKLERNYSKYATEIKSNLERGTAL